MSYASSLANFHTDTSYKGEEENNQKQNQAQKKNISNAKKSILRKELANAKAENSSHEASHFRISSKKNFLKSSKCAAWKSMETIMDPSP